jgi:hypothetical protein
MPTETRVEGTDRGTRRGRQRASPEPPTPRPPCWPPQPSPPPQPPRIGGEGSAPGGDWRLLGARGRRGSRERVDRWPQVGQVEREQQCGTAC